MRESTVTFIQCPFRGNWRKRRVPCWHGRR
jgi:hypothetical protein